jgi:hypothetical protein
LDDILVVNESKQGLLVNLNTVVTLLQHLGFFIYWDKSVVVATQVLEYLVIVIDSTDPSFSLPSAKAAAVKTMCESALKDGSISLRSLASIQGNFSWAIPAILFVQSHYRSLQRFFISKAERYAFNLSVKVRLSPSARLDLDWWVANVERVKRKIFFPCDPDMEVYFDAFLTGWSAICDGVTMRGPWTHRDKRKHINELELLGALYAVQAFATKASDIAIRIYLDNGSQLSQQVRRYQIGVAHRHI